MASRVEKKPTGNGKKAWTSMHRGTADRLLTDVLGRVAFVNSEHSPFAQRVQSVHVFGSYLKGIERASDLDLIVTLRRRYDDKARQDVADDERRDARTSSAKNVVDLIAWPTTEVLRYVTGGSFYVSLHEADQVWFLRDTGHPVQLVFGEERPRPKHLGHHRYQFEERQEGDRS